MQVADPLVIGIVVNLETLAERRCDRCLARRKRAYGLIKGALGPMLGEVLHGAASP